MTDLFQNLLIAFLEPARRNDDVELEALVLGPLLQRTLEPRVKCALVVEPSLEERPYALYVTVKITAT